jgi:hypothetical protein
MSSSPGCATPATPVAATVTALAKEIDDDDQRSVLAVSHYITEYADVLPLEHRGPNVRIDLAGLVRASSDPASEFHDHLWLLSAVEKLDRYAIALADTALSEHNSG